MFTWRGKIRGGVCVSLVVIAATVCGLSHAATINYLSIQQYIETRGYASVEVRAGEEIYQFAEDSWDLDDYGPNTPGVFDSHLSDVASAYNWQLHAGAQAEGGAHQKTTTGAYKIESMGTATADRVFEESISYPQFFVYADAWTEGISALEIVFEVPAPCVAMLDGMIFYSQRSYADAEVKLTSLGGGTLFSSRVAAPGGYESFYSEFILMPGEIYTLTAFGSVDVGGDHEYPEYGHYEFTFDCIIPEPATLVLFSIGLVAMGVARTRRAR